MKISSGDGGPSDVQLRDLNNDGHLDYLFGGDHTLGFGFYYGDGTGGWKSSASLGWGYGGTAVGDVDRDGKNDLAVGMHHNYANSGCGSKIMHVCLMPGYRDWSTNVPGNAEDYGMFGNDFGDVNSDGWLDWGSTSFGCCNGGRVYLNNGNGNWTYGDTLGDGNQFSSEFLFADIDVDGNLDALVPNRAYTVGFGDGKGKFRNGDAGLIAVGGKGFFTGGRSGLSFADVDGDGPLEIAFTVEVGPTSSTMPFLYSWADGSWKNLTAGLWSAIAGMKVRWFYTQMGDVDFDGKTDLVLAHSDGITILLGDGAFGWSRDFDLPISAGEWVGFKLGGDVDHDGFRDIGGVYNSGAGSRGRLYLGGGNFTPATVLVSPAGGEKFPPGGVRFIDWTAPGSGAVRLEISISGPSGPWTSINDTAPNSGRYQWIVPQTPSKNCYVRVTSGTGTGATVRPFEILGSIGPAPLLTQLLAPDGGESLVAGSTYDTKFTLSGGTMPASGILEFSSTGPAGPWSKVTDLVGLGAGSATFSWTVPATPTNQGHLRISIADSAPVPQRASDGSNGAFSIVVPAKLDSVQISPSSVTLQIGEQAAFSATILVWCN